MLTALAVALLATAGALSNQALVWEDSGIALSVFNSEQSNICDSVQGVLGQAACESCGESRVAMDGTR